MRSSLLGRKGLSQWHSNRRSGNRRSNRRSGNRPNAGRDHRRLRQCRRYRTMNAELGSPSRVDDHLRLGWQIESRTENLASMRRGRPINHILHLILTLLTCFLWAPVWIGLAIFAGEKHKTISTLDADRRPPVEGPWYRQTPVIVAGMVIAFFVLMGIIGALTS
jgi:hypothetical protein